MPPQRYRWSTPASASSSVVRSAPSSPCSSHWPQRTSKCGAFWWSAFIDYRRITSTRAPLSNDGSIRRRKRPNLPTWLRSRRRLAGADEELPEPCEACAPFGGNHRLVQTVRGEAMGRCSCARGQALTAMDATREGKPTRPRSVVAVMQPRVDGRAFASGERRPA